MSDANQLKNLKDKFNFAEYKFENTSFEEEEKIQPARPDLKINQIAKTLGKTITIFFNLLTSTFVYLSTILISTLEFIGKSLHTASEYITKKSKNQRLKIGTHEISTQKSLLMVQEIPSAPVQIEEVDLINEEQLNRELYIDSYICTLASASGSKANCFIETEIDDIRSLKHSVHFNAEILMIINEKLLASKLMTNIENIEILMSANTKNNNAEMTVTFRLNQNGLTWSTIFSKYIMTGISIGLAPIGGNIVASFRHDIGFKLEQFSIKIDYPILQADLSFKSSQVSFIDKAKRIDTSKTYEEKKC